MNIFQFTLVFLIRVYQTLLSPVLAAVLGPSARCRFTPTCSQYALEAVRLHGAVMGGWLAVRRLGRCHPWGGCGHEPVPTAPFLRVGRPTARLKSEQIRGCSLCERPRPTKNSGRARLQPSLPILKNYHGS